MKYEELIDMMKLDEKVAKVTDICNAAKDGKNENVCNALWAAYDTALEEMIDFIVTQWLGSMKEVK